MWDFVGIVRNNERLLRAERRISILQEEIQNHYTKHRITNDMLELRNLALVSELIISCALKRKESRGLHFTLDYPNLNHDPIDTILNPTKAEQHQI
jgi:L-aspartate oxidase